MDFINRNRENEIDSIKKNKKKIKKKCENQIKHAHFYSRIWKKSVIAVKSGPGALASTGFCL